MTLCSRFLVGLLATTLLTAPNLAWAADTLKDAFTSAYINNPTLAAERAALRGTDEQAATARSGFRPSAQTSTELENSFIDGDGLTASVGTNVSQPLFRGFRTQNSIRQADASIEAGRERLRSVEINVLLDTVTSYMRVIRDVAVVALNQNLVDLLRQQQRAAQDRFTVGELTRTDVAQSDARLARALSNRIAADGVLTTSREFYRRVVGQPAGTLAEPPPLPPLPSSVDEAVDIGLSNSPQLKAAQAAEQAAKHQVAVAKGALLPTAAASLGFNFRDVSGAGFLNRSDFVGSVGVQATIPLYQSGAEYSQIRQAQQLRSQRMLEIAEAERLVTEQVRNAWAQLETARAVIESASSQVRANEIAAEGVRQEATVGSRTTLDVLDAEQELLDSRVQLVRAQTDAYIAAFNVLAAMGRLDVKNLGLDVEVYDPKQHYNRVKDKFIGFREE
jgi:outer membrane protein